MNTERPSKIGMIAFLIALVPAVTWGVQETQVPKDRSSAWELQSSGTTAQLRGLSVVSDKIAWASGSEGTVIRTVDGGASWQNVSVPNADQRQFRDIQAFDGEVAAIMQAGPDCKFFHTEDGGKTWNESFADERKEIFFDAMDFWNDNRSGIVFGDPIDGRLSMARTEDGGKTWKHAEESTRPKTLSGEAAFAASGSCLITRGENDVWIGLGAAAKGESAATSRILHSNDRGKTWVVREAPIVRNESSGIHSIIFANADHAVAVGGNYAEPNNRESVVAISDDGGKTWRKPTGNAPGGYRSAVAVAMHDHKTILVAVGMNGSDWSADFGNEWNSLGMTPFHAVQFTDDGKSGWAVGADGRVARWKGLPIKSKK